MTTTDLVRRLAPGIRDRVIGHELVTQAMIPGEPFIKVRFIGVPAALGTDLCQRTVFVARLGRIGTDHEANWTPEDRVATDGVDRTAELTVAPECKNLNAVGFAVVPFPLSAADAAPALRQLLALQREARGPGALSFDLTCVTSNDRQGLGYPRARAFFAGLRLELLSEINPSLPTTYLTLPQGAADFRRWLISLSPQPGGRWAVSLYGQEVHPF